MRPRPIQLERTHRASFQQKGKRMGLACAPLSGTAEPPGHSPASPPASEVQPGRQRGQRPSACDLGPGPERATRVSRETASCAGEVVAKRTVPRWKAGLGCGPREADGGIGLSPVKIIPKRKKQAFPAKTRAPDPWQGVPSPVSQEAA